MTYREPTPPDAPRVLAPTRMYSRWQRFHRWLVETLGDTDDREDRHWAGGHWAMTFEYDRHLGAAMAQFRGRWHPVAACPHKDFKPVLLMPGQAMDDLYSTCPDCEHWK